MAPIATPAAVDFAEEWDAALARLGAGEGAPATLSPGPCNTRSMAPVPAPPPAASPAPVPARAAESQRADERGGEDAEAEEGWFYPPDEVARACTDESAEDAQLPVVDRLLTAMARRRGERAAFSFRAA